MSLITSLRHAGRKVAASVAATVTAASLLVVGVGQADAQAGLGRTPGQAWEMRNTFLEQGCQWDAVGMGVQRCAVFSPAMGRNIDVQILMSGKGGSAGLYLLDGLRATDYSNAWLVDTNAAAKFFNDNITLVMPVGGKSSFYADWDGPATYDLLNPVTYKWETFLTQELPAYLRDHFGVDPSNNSIAGISMGGTSAMNLGAKHPNQFRQALSYSGYLTTTLPGWQTLIRVAMLDAGGFNINAMYGSMIDPRRFENDPFLNLSGLRNSDVYVSAASGIPGPDDQRFLPQHQAAGAALEVLSRASTQVWTVKARAEFVNFAEDYPALGLHNFAEWDKQLDKTRPRILDVMNAHGW